MKRIVALLLIFVMMFTFFALTGCQSTNSDEDADNTQEETNDTAHEHHKYVFEHLSDGNRLYYSRNEHQMEEYRAIYQETGCNPVVSADDFHYEENENATIKIYTNVVINEKYQPGCVYYIMTMEDYEALQEYQNRTGRQVIYPTVNLNDRPENEMYKRDGNIYYKVDDGSASVLNPLFDENGNYIPNYWKYNAEDGLPSGAPEYNSLRIEGENGFIDDDGNSCFYVYGRLVQSGVEVRAFIWEMYQYLKETDPDNSLGRYFEC